MARFLRGRVAGSMALACALVFPPESLASEAWEDVLRFHGADRVMTTSLSRTLEQLAADDPELLGLAKRAMESGSFSDRAIDLLAQRMQARLSDESLQYYQRFMATPSGVRMAELVRQTTDPAQLDAALRAEPPPHRANFLAFNVSPEAAEVVAFLGSEEAQKLGAELGKTLACDQIARELPLEHEVMLVLEHCPPGRDHTPAYGPAGVRASVAAAGLLYSADQLRKAMAARFGEGTTDAELRAISQRVLRDDFDADTFAGRIGDRLEARSSPEHLARVVAFSGTRTGRQLTQIVQTTAPDDLVAAIDQQGPDFQRRLLMLYRSPAWESVVAQMQAEDIGTLLLDYTKELICAGARRDDRALSVRLVSSGRCPDGEPAAGQ